MTGGAVSKRCAKCGETKPVSEFRANRRMRDGVSSWCADCHNAARRRWRQEQRALALEGLEARRVAHVEALREQDRRRKRSYERLERLRRERADG